MLLRNSLAKTKRLFQKTVQSFKSLISGGYEKLPKTPTFKHCSCAGGGDFHSQRNLGELENYHGDFTSRWDSSDPEKGKKKNEQQQIDQGEIYGGSFLKFGKQSSPAKISHEERRRETGKEIKRADSHGRRRRREEMSSQILSESNVRDGIVLVQKLKELEMMDAGDIEHVLDIEEVIHYYSRLTCPAYLDIVNRFFMEMYSDFFLHQPSSSDDNNQILIP